MDYKSEGLVFAYTWRFNRWKKYPYVSLVQRDTGDWKMISRHLTVKTAEKQLERVKNIYGDRKYKIIRDDVGEYRYDIF